MVQVKTDSIENDANSILYNNVFEIDELVFFHIIIAGTLTSYNICLTYLTITPSNLIYAYALRYILSIKDELVIRNIM